jgi:Tfp pilus assembly ATPase PilU
MPNLREPLTREQEAEIAKSIAESHRMTTYGAYATCERLVQSYVDANRKRVEEYSAQGLESLARIHDAKRDTAQQILNHIRQFKAAEERNGR